MVRCQIAGDSKMKLRSILTIAFCLLASTAHARHGHARHHQRHWQYWQHYDRGHIVSHPDGCPRFAFCGCGASVRVFGHSIRELWLAANWFKFPRTSWAPGVAGVRRHHVFIVEQVLGNGWVLAWDANSGGGQTRVHEISTAGYVPVQPHG